MTTVIKDPGVLQFRVLEERMKGLRVGLVPTMGFLHEGHLNLVRKSREENDFTVVSIFVNPIQFGPSEDLARYPRNIERDLNLLEEEGVDILFKPEAEEMYFPDHSVFVDEIALSRDLCGASRPGHFRGVCTVVLKLLNIVGPHRAYFGQKDYQQLRVIQRMVRDLNVPVEIRSCPIVRDSDGLARSSRNAYLSERGREAALLLSASLEEAKLFFNRGERDVARLKARVEATIAGHSLNQPEYVEIRDAETLRPLNKIEATALVALAVRVEDTRLIDNCLLEV